MGIKNLLKFLQENNLVKEINDSDVNNKKIAIDISIMLYQIIIAIRNSGKDLKNSSGQITSHILGLFNKTVLLLKKNITPVYVFDGKPPKIKEKILEIRRNIKKKSYLKYTQANDIKEKIKYFKRFVCVTKKQIEESKELLKLMGVPFIEAPEEADSQCAYLAKNGYVDGVLTEDMDILTFGSPKIYRNLASYNKPSLIINLKEILDYFEFSYEEFVEFCILLGCDYCDRVKFLKPNKLLEYFNTNSKKIVNTIDDLKSQNIKTQNYNNYKEIKNYFIFKNNVNKNIPNLELSKPDIIKLEDLLINKYSLLKNKIKLKLIFLKNRY